jgi:hypothetical protein
MALKQLRLNLNRRNRELFANGDKLDLAENETNPTHDEEQIELENKIIDYLSDPFIEMPLNSIQLLLKFNLNNSTRLNVSLLNDVLTKFAYVYRFIKYLASTLFGHNQSRAFDSLL